MKNVQALPINRIRPSPAQFHHSVGGPNSSSTAATATTATATTATATTATALRFADAVAHLGEAARSLGLTVPAFRSPPRLAQADRSIKRRPDGGSTVSVRLQGRPWQAVLADLVEGVVVANALVGKAAMAARSSLWSAVVSEVPHVAA